MRIDPNIFGFTRTYFGMAAVEWLALAGFVALYCADVVLALHHLL
jgi:hypothetical protein